MRDMCKEEDYAFLNKQELDKTPEKTSNESMFHESEWQQNQEERVNTPLKTFSITFCPCLLIWHAKCVCGGS